MAIIKTVKGDITKITDNPDSFDLVEWVLFDSVTESVYEVYNEYYHNTLEQKDYINSGESGFIRYRSGSQACLRKIYRADITKERAMD